MDGRWRGDPAAIQAALAARQPVGFGALVALGDAVLLSRSPELFFALDGAGGIEARPMKGTAPRDADAGRDAALAAALAADPKNRAENLMIVDLLRNDIGADRRDRLGAGAGALRGRDATPPCTRWCRGSPGGCGRDVGCRRILAALFPCGSVTGAPKMRAMEIIRELEPWPRDAYCGAIGWAAPDGRAAFNVAIRTVTLYPRRRGGAERRRRGGGRFDGRGGIRGGAVESPVRRPLPDDLTLIETFGRRDGRASSTSPTISTGWRAPPRPLGVPYDRRGDRPGARRRAAARTPLRVRLTLALRRGGRGRGGAAGRRGRRSGGWRSPASGSTPTTRGCG